MWSLIWLAILAVLYSIVQGRVVAAFDFSQCLAVQGIDALASDFSRISTRKAISGSAGTLVIDDPIYFFGAQ